MWAHNKEMKAAVEQELEEGDDTKLKVLKRQQEEYFGQMAVKIGGIIVAIILFCVTMGTEGVNETDNGDHRRRLGGSSSEEETEDPADHIDTILLWSIAIIIEQFASSYGCIYM